MVEALVEQVAWLTPTSLFVLLNVVIATILVSTSFHRHPKKPHQDPHNHDESSPLPAQPPPALARTPSLFSRVTSFNLSNYYPSNTERYHHDDEDQYKQHQYQASNPSPSFFTRVASFKFSGRADEQPDLEHERQGYQEPDPEPATQSPMKRDINYNKSDVVNRVQQVGPAAAVRRTVPRAPSLLSRVTSFNFSGVGRDQQEEAKEEASERHVSRDEPEKVVGKKVNKAVKKENKTKSLPRERTSFKVDEEVDNKADDFINRFKQQLKLQRIESLIRQRSA